MNLPRQGTFLSVLLLCTTRAHADAGTLIPRDKHGCEASLLSVVEMSVEVTLD